MPKQATTPPPNWKPCTCLKDSLKMVLERMQKEVAEGRRTDFTSINDATYTNTGFTFSNKDIAHVMFNYIELRGIKKNKQGIEKEVKKEIPMVHAFCSMCGNPLKNPSKTAQEG